MKKIFIIFLLVFSHSLFAQEEKAPKTFHRLLIFNENNELMLVKIKNMDFWVTPGLYQNTHQQIKEGLDSIANTYGLTILDLKLKGVFALKNESDQTISIRNVFTAHTKDPVLHKPEIIEEVKWLPVKEAMNLITFPHINYQINQITQHPNTVWSGSLSLYKKGNKYGSEILEDFYPIFEHDASVKVRNKEKASNRKRKL